MKTEQLNLDFDSPPDKKKEDEDTKILRSIIKDEIEKDKNFKFTQGSFNNILVRYLARNDDKNFLRNNITDKMAEEFDLEIMEEIKKILEEEGGRCTQGMRELLKEERKKINKRYRDWPTFIERSMPKD